LYNPVSIHQTLGRGCTKNSAWSQTRLDRRGEKTIRPAPVVVIKEEIKP